MAKRATAATSTSTRYTHLRDAGARLWNTGGYTALQAQHYCSANHLNQLETAWVMIGWAYAMIEEKEPNHGA